MENTKRSEKVPNLRLVKVLAALNIEQQAIATKLGMSASYLSQVKGGSRPLSADFAVKFELAFGINAKWLLTEEGAMIADKERAMPYLHRDFVPPQKAQADAVSSFSAPGTAKTRPYVNLPLLDKPDFEIPENSAFFSGTHVLLPTYEGPRCYCVRAPEDQSVFRSDEFLLVGPPFGFHGQAEDVWGRLCFAQMPGVQEIRLYRIERGDDRDGPTAIKATPISDTQREPIKASWYGVKLAGTVLMAFRTHFAAMPSGNEGERDVGVPGETTAEGLDEGSTSPG